jgi:hypothetical protein
MSEPMIRNPISMNGTFREANSVLFARTMTKEEREQTRMRLNIKEDPQTIVHFYSPGSALPISHPIAAPIEEVIAEFKKAGVTLTPTITKDLDGEKITEAVNLSAVADGYKAFKSSNEGADKKFGSKVQFRDLAGGTGDRSREYWLLTRPEAFHGERKVPGFGNGSGE